MGESYLTVFAPQSTHAFTDRWMQMADAHFGAARAAVAAAALLFAAVAFVG